MTASTERLQRSGVDVGVWCDIGGADVVELLATTGVGWVAVDGQHGAFDDQEIRRAIAATTDLGCRALVRVVTNEGWAIGRALDAGAAGVIVPMVSSHEDATRAVRASKYPPKGERSWGPLRSGYGRSVTQPHEANSTLLCAVMVETRAGLAQVEDIAAVDGVDMIFVGPLDLSLALGTTVDALLADRSPSAPLPTIAQACRSSGIIAGAFAGDAERARQLEDLGFTMIAAATASGLLFGGARSLLRIEGPHDEAD